MTNVHRFARRQHGVCTGHLWKQEMLPDQLKKKKKPPTVFCYCVLVGVTFTTYENVQAYLRGDYPMSVVRIVGANAWNDHCVKSASHSTAAAPAPAAATTSAEATSTTTTTTDLSFRMVTSQGSHIYCTAGNADDVNLWLGSLHAGLEASFSSCSARELPPLIPPSPKIRGTRRLYCRSCGKAAIGDVVILESIPLPQYGFEQRTEVCCLCAVAQGVLLHVTCLSTLYQTNQYECDALEAAREICWSVVHEQDEDASHKLRPNLVHLVQSTSFGKYRRVCPFVEEQCYILEHGGSPAAFLEALQQDTQKTTMEKKKLKKQAFRVAGDMGSAMKLLQEYACGDLDMLRTILEFFLDLIEEGELNSVAFFWPQLQCIHLRMLPPENIQELARVDLMEDFLITVAVKHSVHLALELTWGYAADLEESLYNPNCNPACRQRRFAVLKFVCELESLLFDFEHGWGGGSVSVKKMISPSPHQVTLLRLSVLQLQECRQRIPASLSRSVRMDKLQHAKSNLPPDEAAQEALRIATNADYFSSQLSFMRRLGDTAERLRFMELSKRAPALQRELSLLNSSGSMGGDPLNRIHENLIRIVRIPSREGHVFRSKERTPVLLLLEVDEEGVEKEDASDKNVVEELVQSKPASTTNAKDASNEGETIPSNGVANDQDEGTDDESESDDYDDTQESNVAETEDKSQNGEDDAESEAEANGVEYTNDGDKVSQSKGGERPAAAPEDRDLYTKPLKSVVVESSVPIHHSPRALGKLKHFESPNEPSVPATPSKAHVQEMVDVALTNQLDIPNLDYTTSTDEKLDAPKEQSQKEDDLPGKPTISRLNRTLYGSMNAGRKMNVFASDIRGSSFTLPKSEIRREVLTTIMMTGMRRANAIAAGAAEAAQRSLQELDRKRAVEMILHGDEEKAPGSGSKKDDVEESRQKLLECGMGEAEIAETLEGKGPALPSEEDEAMESLRLLLLQYRVGQGTMSAEDAAIAMAQPAISSVLNVSPRRDLDSPGGKRKGVDKSEMIEIDAGDVDPRLSGCGSLPPAALSALTLWKAEVVSNGELIELVKKDLDYIRHVGVDEENSEKLIENSQFWGRFAFGERWAEKRARLAASSPFGSRPGWDLIGVIVKSNDDLRQEAFVMQLIELCDEAFQLAGLDLWLHPYRILATGRTTGVIEMVKNAMSFDSLKKRPGYGRGGLREHLKRMTEYTADPVEAFQSAQQNFVRSLAAYSLLSYFFLFKDRHNGNILLDTAGHVIHIDFGFVFGVAPGGSFSLEMSTPFKLTEEMMEVMGGMESPLFSEFVTLFCCGFLALQAHADTFGTIVEITCRGSSFKCFEGRDAEEVVTKLRERFVPELDKDATVTFALDLIKLATKSYGTKQYDYFQYLSQGIAT